MKKNDTDTGATAGAQESSLFSQRRAQPMSAVVSASFESPDCLYELNLDGMRCLAYLSDGTDLRDRLGRSLSDTFPELRGIHRGVKEPCVLDGEIIFLKEGKPDPMGPRGRVLSGKAQSAGQQAHFVAYDLLYKDGRPFTAQPLWLRKQRLDEIVTESSELSVLQYVEKGGLVFYSLALARGYGGVVAKQKNSLYSCGRASRDWALFEPAHRARFIVCGVLSDGLRAKSLALAVYRDARLTARGYVSKGITPEISEAVLRRAALSPCRCPFGLGQPGVQWFSPGLVCEVEYAERTPQGAWRRPKVLWLCPDRRPEECVALTDGDAGILN